MNRRNKVLAAALLGISTLLSACGGEPTSTFSGSPENGVPVSEAAAVSATPTPEEKTVSDTATVRADYGPLGYTFGGCSFGIFDQAEPVLDALGTPADTFTADSCAYQGSDYFYYYDGLELCVNDIDGVRYITGITPTDDTVPNPQGVRIGMDIAEALEKMNMDHTESGGVYSFVSGSTLLMIQTAADGTVKAIQYSPV